MKATAKTRCPYCSHRLDGGKRRPSREHPLSETLGSSWNRWETCDACNRELGKLVDQPFADKLWVREQRHFHQIRDARGRLPGPPELLGELEDGTPVRVIMHRGGWYPKMLPTVEDLGNKQVRIRVDADDADPHAVLARKRARLEKQLGKPIEDLSVDDQTVNNPRVTVRGVEDTFLWPQMGAKVALSAAHELLGDDWLDTPHARWLQDVLWRRPTKPSAPFAPLAPTAEVLSPNAYHGLFRPPEHVVMVLNGQHGAAVQLVLFGRNRYLVPVGTSVDIPTVWWIDPLSRRHERLPFGEFGAKLVTRQQQLAA